MPVGKAYFGFTDEELLQIDRFVRRNTTEKFGPVRHVVHEPEQGLVLEVAFEGLARSPRHKSGVAMRFPRINRLRWDKPPREADRLETLERMLKARFEQNKPSQWKAIDGAIRVPHLPCAGLECGATRAGDDRWPTTPGNCRRARTGCAASSAARQLAVAFRLILLSILVGVVLAAIGFDPWNIVYSIRLLFQRIWDLGFDAINGLWRYFLLGAVIVIPVWLLSRLFGAPRGR